MTASRRDFLLSSLAFTLGGCANLGKKAIVGDDFGGTSSRVPSAIKTLGYRLSTPIEELLKKSHYTAIVVGSGYGASVMAARLSSKYKDLCVLERGKEWHPGDFPENPFELGNTFKTPVTPMGLIDIAPGKDLEIVCANGLGGTSLINAAIAIRPELNVFDLPVWPGEITADARSGRLESFYQLAESVLQPNKLNAERFAKTKLHKANAQALGKQWGELNLNIRKDSFGDTKQNPFGYPQSRCVQCGNCCSGCNYGAKNTLVTNYLYMAYKRGANIFTQVEVERIEKKNSVYVLTVKIYNSLWEKPTIKEITADVVFLGAGAKGSTEILMRSQSADFNFSPALGSRLSANGDVMGMSYNSDTRTDIIADRQNQLVNGMGQQGTIIASYADYRSDAKDVMSQFLLLDGVVPSAFGDLVAKGLASVGAAHYESWYGHLPKEVRKLKMDRVRQDLWGASSEGALNHSMLYFACGHDSSGGKFVYHKDKNSFDYVWDNVTEEATFQRVQSIMQDFAKTNGGNYIKNPRETVWGGKKIQATHPLGGCPMGSSVTSGVVDHLGAVFDPKGDYHKNLYVVDASIIPHSLSATPLLTITALAERIADTLLKA